MSFSYKPNINLNSMTSNNNEGEEKNYPPTYFPEQYLLPDGYYHCVITDYCIEQLADQASVAFELLPLQAFKRDEDGEKVEFAIPDENKGRFPLRFQFKVSEGYYGPRLASSGEVKPNKKQKFVKAVTGDYTIANYISFWEEMKGKQITIALIQKGVEGRKYMAIPEGETNITRVKEEKYIKLPADYNREDNGITFRNGVKEQENWLRLVPESEWTQIINYSMLPPSDFIYFVPQATTDVPDWFLLIRGLDKEISENLQITKILGTPLRVVYIKKKTVRNENGFYVTDYPSNLETIKKVIKETGLEAISKEELWKVVEMTTPQEYYNWRDAWMKENCPEIAAKIVKKEKPTMEKLSKVD